MVICLFGENCTGKSSIANELTARMGGKLPAPVEAMLERKHGMFDAYPHELHIHTNHTTAENAAKEILDRVAKYADSLKHE